MKKKLWLLLSLIIVTGCTSQYASNKLDQYLEARNGSNLVIAPPLTSSNISYFYALPAQTQQAKIGVVPPKGNTTENSSAKNI